jgi:signal transduction histidine kinase
VNLLQNAIEATPGGKRVTLAVAIAEGDFHFSVRDEGPGLPEELRSTLFAPCQSTKTGGSGIGLAISKHLANHLGAVLELAASSETGCVFTLRIPVAVCGSARLPAPASPV